MTEMNEGYGNQTANEASERDVTGSSVIVAAKEQVFSDLGDEVVLLNVRTGVYFGLKGVGAKIWGLIQQPRRLSDIRDALLKDYAVEPSRCQRDVSAWVRQLLDAGLVEVTGGQSA